MIRITPTTAVRLQGRDENYGLSKFEHLEELHPGEETTGSRPLESQANSRLKIWKTRRREDGKIFIAQEFEDTKRILEAMHEPMLRLLNHPNLVSLIDIVRDSDVLAHARDYTVWDDADLGNLNRVLARERAQKKKRPLPESLCWHVLAGAAAALLYLHRGYKRARLDGPLTLQDPDWHPVLLGPLDPTNIYFTSTSPPTPYGRVQLGGFGAAQVCAGPSAASAHPPPYSAYSAYAPPETQGRGAPWSPAAEIWSLGAVLGHMMSGAPGRALPQSYSQALRGLVEAMLSPSSKFRPGTYEVLKAAEAGRSEGGGE